MPFHWNARTPKDSHSELSIWGRSFQLLSYREERGTQADLAHSCRMRVCRRVLLARPLRRQKTGALDRRRAKLWTTASTTAGQTARNIEIITHLLDTSPLPCPLIPAWEAHGKPWARQRCLQTPQHHALRTDATAMTQRESYSAIACLPLSWSGRSDDSPPTTARLYAHG
jgi:hypothetical protein